ncbi:MAG: DUF4126 domain-containing protein [Gemmatimonadota bacterium]|nr:DUF4126 domain-containing protein [Gemmatimonadota bacterium]MDH3421352.1 DUF4126 domain-containing protein [Gemmatimonadota bacterium]
MADLPPEFLVLVPLALTAGIDLYLTLLFLGAAPTTPWWDHPLPGSLGDLDSLGVLLTVGAFYIMEFAAERFPPAALVWNAFHAVIRPVSGALVALLLLEGQSLPIILSGVALAAVLASLAHAVRSGAAILRWLSPGPTPHVLLVSLLEDALVLGLIALVLDLPAAALGLSIGLILFFAPTAPSHIRAFAFAIRLSADRVFQTLAQRRWLGQEELPAWVRRTLADDVLAPGGGLRGSPAGAYRLPGASRFATGWVVVRGGSPIFVSRRGPGRTSAVDLGGLATQQVSDTGFFRRVDLTSAGGAGSCVFFSVNGPSEESLRAEFLFA